MDVLMACCQWFLYFVIYSVLGWACETVYCSVGSRKFVNRGFLNGPVCPVYGVGAVAVVLLLRSVSHNVAALFLSGMVVTTVLEYLTSVLLEKLFHMKWWDYSRYRFQINGRVCLLNSLMFGGLSVVMMRFLHPQAEYLVGRIPETWLPWLSLGILAVFIGDTFVTVRSILILKGKMEEIHRLLEEFREKAGRAGVQLRTGFLEKAENLGDLLEEKREKLRLPEGISPKEYLAEWRQRLTQVEKEGSGGFRRLLHAFPNLSSAQHKEALDRLKAKIHIRVRR